MNINKNSGSSLIQELENYDYLPNPKTITKLKYYFEPYNQIKGFRKYMQLSGESRDEDKDLWESVSSM
jgi:hypothetical protein